MGERLVSDRSWIEVNISQYVENISKLKQFFPGKEFLQIVKADAYGHGAYEISLAAIKSGASMLGVANVEEGALLRYLGIKLPILVLSPSLNNEIPMLEEYSLTPSISSRTFAVALNRHFGGRKKACKIHVSIDTGMGRCGFNESKFLQEFQRLLDLPYLEIEGIFSHYAASEDDLEYSKVQSEKFTQIIKSLEFTPKYIHLSNSYGVVNCPDEISNLVRLGLLSYGIAPSQEISEISEILPIMNFKTRVSHLNTINKGESIGYNRTFIAKSKTTYALLPVGYADGYDYLLSNKGYVRIKDCLCPILGKISMDMLAVDVTGIKGIKLNEEAVLFDQSEPKVVDLVKLYGGSAYEFLCQTGRRARRYYFQDNKLISSSPLSHREFFSPGFNKNELNEIIQDSLHQRLKQKEIAEVVYKEILRKVFVADDKQVSYKKDFQHEIIFSEHSDVSLSDYYQVKTRISFIKEVQSNFFYVACAKDTKVLEKYFQNQLVQYRWLLDDNLSLNHQMFNVTKVTVNKLDLQCVMEAQDDNLMFNCSHPQLQNMIGEEALFRIETMTYYPRKSHQLTVFISEITKGIRVAFKYPSNFPQVETSLIFSGRNKFPVQNETKNSITIETNKDEWVFPNSGIVWSY